VARDKHMCTTFRTSLILCCLLAAACTPALHIEPGPALNLNKPSLFAERQGHSWWQLRFRLTWPEGEQADLSRHLLIAEQILLPVISEHEDQLSLWRFHRRAARDGAGNQFSLIVFTDAATAGKIEREVQDNPLTQWLQERSMIEKIAINKRSPEELGKLEETSDKNWPPEIQRSWPYFIMGASQTWLMLVQEISREQALAGNIDYHQLLEHYRIVDSKLNVQWRDYGQHAYLHHLNAVFGYQPVRIRSSEFRSF